MSLLAVSPWAVKPSLSNVQKKNLKSYITLFCKKVHKGEMDPHALKNLRVLCDRADFQTRDLQVNHYIQKYQLNQGAQRENAKTWNARFEEGETGMTLQEWSQIQDWVSNNRYGLHLQALQSGEFLFISSNENLPRSLFVTPSGKVYVLFNKTHKGDTLFAQGAFRKAKYAMDFDNGEKTAFLTEIIHNQDQYQDCQNEAMVLKDLKGWRFAPEVYAKCIRQGKNGLHAKQQMVQSLLPQMLSDSRGMTEREAVSFGKKVFRVIHDLHETYKRAHCDLKPANIGFDDQGNVILIDFGSSLDFGTFTDTMKATPGYMSPALLKELESPTPCITEKLLKDNDLFALGVILYQLVYSCDAPWFEFQALYNRDKAAYRERFEESLKECRLEAPELEFAGLRALIFQLLHPESAFRPRSEDVLEILSLLEESEASKKTASPESLYQPENQ